MHFLSLHADMQCAALLRPRQPLAPAQSHFSFAYLRSNRSHPAVIAK